MTTNPKTKPDSFPVLSPLRAACDWSLSVIDAQNWIKGLFFKAKPTRYPVKLLRYWFMYHLIKEHQERLGRPLKICEIGVDRGQMLRFTRDSGFTDIENWVAVDCNLQTELKESGYTRQIEANVDLPDFSLDEKYDVIIVLHVLEHLLEPELLTSRLTPNLSHGGILIGGFPVTPEWLVAYWQKRIRLTASKFGHVSVFSPQRVKQMAISCGLSLNFISGAFFLRKSGSFLENSQGWLRLNLIWGALFPSLGGEIYWRMSKPISNS